MFVNDRLGTNVKKESHGLKEGAVTLLQVWAMEDNTRDFLLVEVIELVAHMMTFGYWNHNQAEWKK